METDIKNEVFYGGGDEWGDGCEICKDGEVGWTPVVRRSEEEC